MLWIFGSILLAVWFVLKFLLHKSGMVNVMVLIALNAFLIQFVQDRRTKAYKRSINQ